MSESETPKEPISVFSVITIMLEQLAEVAWSKMGFKPDYLTGTYDRNLPEAKVAIDVIADITKHLDPELDDADRRQLQSLLRDLRVNYVEKVKETGA